MASSQVEFSSTASSPFGCTPRRDHNRRDANVTATHVARFRNNLKTLVIDRLNDCISISTPLDDHNNDPQTTTQMPHPDNRSSKLGASSLVQIWEKRLNVVSSNVNKQQVMEMEHEHEREHEHEHEHEQACSVEAGDFEDDAGPVGSCSEDGFADWQSSRTSSSSPPASSAASASAGESEKVRVLDIIRRLTLTAAAKPPPPPPHCAPSSCLQDNNQASTSHHPSLILRHQVDPKCLSYILCSPRIRGRQAFADLLFQIQQDRKKELHTLRSRRVVSKFPQRGRIQSLLRLKILKRGMALEDEQQRPKFVITPRENHTSSTIMHLRERFSGVGENGGRSSFILTPHNDDVKTHLDSETNDNSNGNGNGNDNNNNKNNNDNDNQQVNDAAIHSSIDITVQDSPIGEDVKEIKTHKEQGGHKELDPPTLEATWQDTPNLKLDSQESIIGWEDSEAPEETFEGTSYEWFTHISRPRIYWEKRRQTWYQEMLDSNSANDEICELIKRKTVSNFLTSEFREKMDKLMVSRLERKTHEAEEEEEEGEGEEEEYDEVNEAEEELWCFSEGHESTQPKSSDNEDERSLISAGQYRGASGYNMDQSASPSILSSWSYQDNEMAGEDSNRGPTSTSSPLLQFSSNNLVQHSNSSTSHQPSIEMELIYDLRGHMEQMYREMSELRKSIKCCMDMQRQSIKHEAVAGSGRGRKSNYKEKSRKHKCCICYDMQIDSLLYRCGHMCSCMKCGKELQWGGGKCPVCGAPIEDVVPVRPSFAAARS